MSFKQRSSLKCFRIVLCVCIQLYDPTQPPPPPSARLKVKKSNQFWKIKTKTKTKQEELKKSVWKIKEIGNQMLARGLIYKVSFNPPPPWLAGIHKWSWLISLNLISNIGIIYCPPNPTTTTKLMLNIMINLIFPYNTRIKGGGG